MNKNIGSLVSEWADRCGRNEPLVRIAWLSLDEEDSDAPRLLSSLVAALRTVAPELGEAQYQIPLLAHERDSLTG